MLDRSMLVTQGAVARQTTIEANLQVPPWCSPCFSSHSVAILLVAWATVVLIRLSAESLGALKIAGSMAGKRKARSSRRHVIPTSETTSESQHEGCPFSLNTVVNTRGRCSNTNSELNDLRNERPRERVPYSWRLEETQSALMQAIQTAAL